MAISRKEAVAKLWEIGNLQWKLDSTQKDLYSSYADRDNKTIVWACSRRLGKTRTLCIIALELCLKNPNTIIKFVSPQQKQVRSNIRPLIRDIISDCPSHLKPKYNTQDGAWRFINGSEIQIAGTDNGNAESLRGGNAHLCLVDEAGSCAELEYLVQSILLPTMTTTNGKIILASTPPLNSDHAFVKYMQKAELEGTLMKKTIKDNPRLTEKQIDAYIREVAGDDENPYNNVAVLREYFCEIITDRTRAVVPEWSAVLEQEIVTEWSKPPFRHYYVAMDIGFKDLTVVLFAYYDFRKDKLVIEDEVVMNGREMTTEALAASIKSAEKLSFTDIDTQEPVKPYMRVADNNNLVLLNDLHRLHSLLFIPSQKDDKDAALNQMRMRLGNKGIIINPKCKTLISHLKNAIWNKARTSYERSADQGHYDAVDALVYLVRNIYYTLNPYPANYDIPKGEYFESGFYNDPELSSLDRHFKDLYTVKSGFKKKRQY